MLQRSKSEEYDLIYEAASALIRLYVPCDIHKERGVVKCATDSGQLCCNGCTYLTRKGCSVKSIWCKLWLCSELKSRYPELESMLFNLRERARKAGISMYGRAGKESYRFGD